MAAIMLFLAYVLPLPIAGACLYFHVFDGVQDVATKLIYIGAASLIPSALLMIFALKRIVHFIFHLLIYGVMFYGAYHFGLIGHATQGNP